MDLAQLQTMCKSDALAYKEEFLMQYRHFLSQIQIYKLKPSKDFKPFAHLIKFLSNVAAQYPAELKEFPAKLAELLEQTSTSLEPELRKTIVQALITLRNKNLLSPASLLPLFFKLFRIPDKKLRELLHNHIVNDIKRMNLKKKDEKTNKSLQNFMYTMLQDPTAIAARKSLEVIIELYRKGIWRDAKTVNVICTGIFSKDSQMQVLTMRFFLVPKEEKYEDEDEDKMNRREIYKKFGHTASKKTKKKSKKLKAALAELNKDKKKELEESLNDTKSYNAAAMNLIHDPHGYMEKVFGVLKKSNEKFEIKIMMMSFLAKLISCHKLILEQFYSWIQRYIAPHQQHITQILALLAQSCHNFVPPEVIEPALKAVVDQFITDRRPPEVIAIGLNTVREMCVRSPLIMNETLLEDLVKYRFFKNKGVMMAARSLISLFRIVNPELLPKKERGKNADLSSKPKGFGEVNVKSAIEGTELLEKYGDDEDFLENMSFEEFDSEDFDEDDESGSIDENSGSEVSGEVENDSEDGEKVDGDNEGDEENEEDEEDEEEIDENDLEEVGSDEEIDLDEIEWSDEEEDGDEDNEANGDNENENGDDDEIPRLEPITKDEVSRSSKTSRTTAKSDVSSRLEAREILSEEDWAKLRKLQQWKRSNDSDRPNRKRKHEEIENDDGDDDVDVEAIEGSVKKKQKLTKEERLELLRENRDSKDRFKVKKASEKGSKTNAMNAKGKPFHMIKHSKRVKAKLTTSMHEKKTKMAAQLKKNRIFMELKKKKR